MKKKKENQDGDSGRLGGNDAENHVAHGQQHEAPQKRRATANSSPEAVQPKRQKGLNRQDRDESYRPWTLEEWRYMLKWSVDDGGLRLKTVELRWNEIEIEISR